MKLFHNILRMMLLAVLMTVRPSAALAQWNSINFDYQTALAMVAEYNAEAAIELYYKSQIDEMLKKYEVAEVATAGIFTSKFLDRKALTDLGLWSDGTENRYYRRIYQLVASKIMPGLWDLAQMMVRYPHKAMYWGSYMVKTTTEVKSLCMQFESIVTNGTLSFGDINFLEVCPQLKAIVQLSEMSGQDWKAVLSDVFSMPEVMSKEELRDEVKAFAEGGFSRLAEDVMGDSEFSGSFIDKAEAIALVGSNIYDIYQACDGDLATLLTDYWGDAPTVADIFTFSGYDMEGWISDYAQEGTTQQYTQRYYIAYVTEGTETVCNYQPPTDSYSVKNSGEWIRYATTNTNYYPGGTEMERVLKNSENYAGWSRATVSTLNQQNTGIGYAFNSQLKSYSITSGGVQTKKAFAFAITVTRSGRQEEVVYEELFDSYTMDLSVFLMKLNALKAEYDDNEQGKVYQILHDDKQFYEVPDAKKMKGAEMAIITMTCTDDIDLGEGSTQYKCNSCGSSLNAHSKECAMRTTIPPDDDLDLRELERMESELSSEVDALQREIDELESNNASIQSYLDTVSIISDTQRAYYERKIASNDAKIREKTAERDRLQRDLDEVSAALAEADNEPEVTDDYNRIPAIMEEVRSNYRLTWQGAGWWSGYTYYREAQMQGLTGTVTFSATLSIARKPRYFLGIKIHRAILKISWKLTTSYTETQVMDTMELDPEESDEEKARKVADRISELARDFPGCRFNTEYIRSAPDEEDETEDVQHLLWASDRLAIARQVESRLVAIYANIVSMQKMMHYRLDVLDAFGEAIPYINDEEGRNLDVAQRCRRRWLRNAANSHHAIGYNGKYDNEEEP